MASSKRPRSAEPVVAAVAGFLRSFSLEKKRVAAGLSGGVDSVVLLHVLNSLKAGGKFSLEAVHVHHGLSRNAGAWAKFCGAYCRRLDVPLAVHRVRVVKKKDGLGAAGR